MQLRFACRPIYAGQLGLHGMQALVENFDIS